jgi:hypothetical protein
MNRNDYYANRRFTRPEQYQKYKTGYDLDSDALQVLISQAPDLVQSYTFDLSVAQAFNLPFPINVSGTSFRFRATPTASLYNPVTNTGTEPHEPSGFVVVKVNQSRAENAMIVKSNSGWVGDFNGLFLAWPAQGAISGRLEVYKYDSHPYEFELDTRMSGTEASMLVTALNGAATGVVSQVLPVDLTRKNVLVQVISGGPVYFGGPNVTGMAGTNIGTQLQNGDILRYRNTSALYAITDGTTAVLSINAED